MRSSGRIWDVYINGGIVGSVVAQDEADAIRQAEQAFGRDGDLITVAPRD